MKRVTVRGTVERPIEDVFDFLLDNRNDERWCPMASGYELVEGDAPGVGTVYRYQQAQGPGMPPLDSYMRTTVAERPTRLEWDNAGRGLRYHATIVLQPDGATTHVQHTNAVSLPNVAMQLAWFTGAQLILRRQLRNLAKELAR